MNEVTLSKGQKKQYYIGAFSIFVFMVLTIIGFNYFHALFENIETDITTFDILKTIVPWTLGASAILCTVLIFLFGKESKKILPKGFYTSTSWLDITHSNLVMIDQGKLIQFEIPEKKMPAVQVAYQTGEGVEKLYEISGSDEQQSVFLSECTQVTSEHNSHDIDVEHNESNQTFVFMSPIVKTHALISMKSLFPKNLNYSKVQKTRLQAAIPSLIILMVIAVIVYFMSGVIVNSLLIALAVFAILPIMIKGLLFPPMVESWETPKNDEKSEAAGIEQKLEHV